MISSIAIKTGTEYVPAYELTQFDVALMIVGLCAAIWVIEALTKPKRRKDNDEI